MKRLTCQAMVGTGMRLPFLKPQPGESTDSSQGKKSPANEMTLRFEARYIPANQSKKGGLKRVTCTHRLKLLLPDEFLRSWQTCFQPSLAAAPTKAFRWLGAL